MLCIIATHKHKFLHLEKEDSRFLTYISLSKQIILVFLLAILFNWFSTIAWWLALNLGIVNCGRAFHASCLFLWIYSLILLFWISVLSFFFSGLISPVIGAYFLNTLWMPGAPGSSFSISQSVSCLIYGRDVEVESRFLLFLEEQGLELSW